jgi:hypothetical protein
MERISITIPDDLLQRIDARANATSEQALIGKKGFRSQAISQALAKYFDGLEASQQRLQILLSSDEMNLVRESLKGKTIDNVRLLWAYVSNFLETRIPLLKETVDGPALVQKIRDLDYMTLCALVESEGVASMKRARSRKTIRLKRAG